MDGHELNIAWREYYRKRRMELLEGLRKCSDIERQRGKLDELDTTAAKIKELMNTTGDDDD